MNHVATEAGVSALASKRYAGREHGSRSNLADARELVIDATGTDRQYWNDVLEFRELFYFLAWRDIIIRYKQAAIGIGWAVFQPLITMAIFTFIFSRVAGLKSPDAPYPLMVLSGLLAWQFVSQGVSAATNSLVGNSNLVSKVYFPRLLIPASTVGVSVVDFLISLVLFFALMVVYSHPLSWNVLALPFFVGLAILTTLAFGVWLSALAVKYRDVRFAIPFVIQVGLFLSPVGFRSDVVTEKVSVLYALNPMVGIIDGFRWSLLAGERPFPLLAVGLSLAVSLLALLTGVRYFRRTERKLADII